jgi:hypothetical protein
MEMVKQCHLGSLVKVGPASTLKASVIVTATGCMDVGNDDTACGIPTSPDKL